MLELIRTNSLSWHQMMTASKGALQVPAEEMVEILVYIADHNKIMGDQARLTLAGWDETVVKAMAANPDSPREVLNYWILPKNLRPALFPLLLENDSVSVSKLGELASTTKGQWIDAMIASPRVRGSRHLLQDLSSNKELSVEQAKLVQELIAGTTAPAQAQSTPKANAEPVATAALSAQANHAAAAAPDLGVEHDPEADQALVVFFSEHAAEIAAEGNKPFQAIGGIYDAFAEAEEKSLAAAVSATPTPIAPTAAAPAVAPILTKQHVNPENEKRGSVLQKITKLDIKGRIQLAMKGNKEERSILVRDGTKIVALAVLDSPKISDGEVEKFASQKNVLEAVLRAIPMKRRFMKNYSVVRNLVSNPRTPLDVSLGLMKNILIADLKNLMSNKEVADTIRKMAMRTYKQKADQAGKK